VDCHNVSGGSDFRFNESLKQYDGHPSIEGVVNTVPDDCKMCHGSYARDLFKITHSYHFENAESNYFVTENGGQCLNCHSLDVSTGVMSVKSAPKNW
jgi:hypothetical protein